MYFEIYIIEGCPYCQATKDLVKTKGLPAKMYLVKPMDKSKFKALNGMPTFPHVFMVQSGQKTKIGGYQEFKQCLEKK